MPRQTWWVVCVGVYLLRGKASGGIGKLGRGVGGVGVRPGQARMERARETRRGQNTSRSRLRTSNDECACVGEQKPVNGRIASSHPIGGGEDFIGAFKASHVRPPSLINGA